MTSFFYTVLLPSAVVFALGRVVLLRSGIRFQRVVLPSAVVFALGRVVLLRSGIRLATSGIAFGSGICLTASGIASQWYEYRLTSI